MTDRPVARLTCGGCAGGWHGRTLTWCETEASPRYWTWQRNEREACRKWRARADQLPPIGGGLEEPLEEE